MDGFSIYESLNSVEEFPDYMELSLKEWAQNLYTILEKTSEFNSDKFIEAKKVAVDIICLFFSRFSDFMTDYTKIFFEKIWSMLSNLPPSKIFNEFVASLTDFINVSLRDKDCRETI